MEIQMMRRSWLLAGLAGLACCLLGLPPARAAEVPAAASFSANVAIDWFDLATRVAQLTPGNSPPVVSRSFAYMAVTLHESVIAGMPGHRALAGQLNELQSLPPAQPDEAYHWPTVAHAALGTMVRMMFPNATAEMKARIDTLDRELPLKHAADFEAVRLDVERGIRSTTHGKLLAMAVMTWARTDGGHENFLPAKAFPSKYLAPSGPGRWVPTPPRYDRALLPYWGRNRTFTPGEASACAPPPPPAYSEEAGSPFYREAEEVWRISTQATQAQRQAALYWADDAGKTPTPPGHWIFILNDLLRERRATLEAAAVAYAQLSMAMADAFIGCWAVKYRDNLVRPVTYVQQVFDSQWLPPLMETPPFPEYSSGHSVQSAAAASVLGALFGERTAFTDNTHNDRGWGPRRFESFAEAAQEAALSRLYAGIHYRSAVELGQVQGRCIATRVLGLRWRE
jgi:hypothetical protein